MPNNAATSIITCNWNRRHDDTVRVVVRRAIKIAKNQRKWMKVH